MKQLTMGEILRLVEHLKAYGMTYEEITALPVYIGDDEELNGIHSAYFYEYVDDQKSDVVKLIEANCTNKKFTGKAILIS